MKITILMPPFVWIPSGSNRVVYEYANHLLAYGNEVTLVHPLQIDRTKVSITSANSIRSQWLYWRRRFTSPMPRWFTLNPRVRVLKVPSLAATYMPESDVILATQWFLAEQVHCYPDGKGKKFYLIHHHEGMSGYPPERVEATWKLPLWKVAVSRLTYDQVSSVAQDRVFHIANGIDHTTYRLRQPIDQRLQQVAMMYVAKSIKDPATGIKALTIAKKRFPALQAILFGVGARDASIPDWITYHRHRPDHFIVKEIYNRSAIFLCSSRLEGFGFPPAEAMACGCAVVSTDCGGVRDYLEHGINCLLSLPEDHQTLAQNLCRLLENERLRIQLATAGHQQIQHLDWNHSAGTLHQLMARSL